MRGLSRFACCPDGWVVSVYWCADIGPDGDQTAMGARCQHPGDGRKTLPRPYARGRPEVTTLLAP